MSNHNTTVNVHKRPRTPDSDAENTFPFSVPTKIARNQKKIIEHIEKRRKKDGNDPLLSSPLQSYDLKQEGNIVHVVHKKSDTKRLRDTRQEFCLVGDRLSTLEEQFRTVREDLNQTREELALLKQQKAEWTEKMLSYEVWDRVSTELKRRLETSPHLLASRDAVDSLPRIWDVSFAIPLALIYSCRNAGDTPPAPFWETGVDNFLWGKIRDWARATFRKPSKAQVFVDDWHNLSNNPETSSDAGLIIVCFLQHMLFKDARHGAVHIAPTKRQARTLLQKMMKTPGCPAFSRAESIVQMSKFFK